MDDERLNVQLALYRKAPTPELLDELVRAFLPLSRAIAWRCRNQGVELEDLQQVAAMALITAIQKFQPERGLRFSTYATPTILGQVRNYIRDKGSMIRINRDTRSQLQQLERVTDALRQELQHEPGLQELAVRMNMEPEALLALLDERQATGMLSLNSIPQGAEEDTELQDKLGTSDPGYEQVENNAFYQWAMSQLTPTEQQLVRLRFELRLGQRETAVRLDVSQMQVSRMERRLLSRLRNLANENGEARSLI